MTVVPNLLDQYRKVFPFLRGEFLSDISITIVMASDGATRRHAVALPPLYKRATRALMPYIRGTVLAVLGLHALHDALDGARTEIVGVGLHRQAVYAHDRLLLAAYTRSHTICSTSSATKSLRVRLASTMASIRFCGTSLKLASSCLVSLGSSSDGF